MLCFTRSRLLYSYESKYKTRFPYHFFFKEFIYPWSRRRRLTCVSSLLSLRCVGGKSHLQHRKKKKKAAHFITGVAKGLARVINALI